MYSVYNYTLLSIIDYCIYMYMKIKLHSGYIVKHYTVLLYYENEYGGGVKCSGGIVIIFRCQNGYRG